jgi:hypothetical protein
MLAKRLVLLLSIGLLVSAGFSASALAEDVPGAEADAAFFEDEECAPGDQDCEESLEAEECEAFEDEEEFCEEELEEASGEAPAECLLTSARPRVSIGGGGEKLRLDVRYTVSGPANVTLSIRGRGGKGSFMVPASRHRLSRNGTLRETVELSGEAMERAEAAREFTVRLRVAGVPSSCHRYDSYRIVIEAAKSERR